MSALTISATLLGTSPILAETDTDTATEESADKEESTDKADSEESDAKNTDAKAEDGKDADAAKGDTLEDGTYTAEFDTDNGMFHVNEANDGKGVLTVKDGKMTIHENLFGVYGYALQIRKSFCGQSRRCPERWSRTPRADNRYCYIQRWNERRSIRI